jgi:hypothetical protein
MFRELFAGVVLVSVGRAAVPALSLVEVLQKLGDSFVGKRERGRPRVDGGRGGPPHSRPRVYSDVGDGYNRNPRGRTLGGSTAF